MNKNVTLRPVSKEEYGKVRELAETIWPVCYKDILSVEQIKYMMDMMYSEDVIAGDTAQGVHYYFVESTNEVAGFLAWKQQNCTNFICSPKNRSRGSEAVPSNWSDSSSKMPGSAVSG